MLVLSKKLIIFRIMKNNLLNFILDKLYPPPFFRKLLLIISFLFLSFLVYQLYNSNLRNRLKSPYELKNSCWNDIDFEKTEKLLKESAIIKKIPFHKYYRKKYLLTDNTRKEKEKFYNYRKKSFYKRNPLYVLFYSNGLKAIWKGKEKDYDSGSIAKGRDRSITAYNISKFIGLKLIPPTVSRSIDEKEGSAQLYVEHISDNKTSKIKELTNKEKTNLYTLAFLLGHTDLGYDNVLISKNCGFPVLVDNNAIGRAVTERYGSTPPFESLNRYKNMNEIDFKSIPFEKTVTLQNPSLELLKNTFSDLSFHKIKRQNRLFVVNNKLTYIIHKDRIYIYRRPELYKYLTPTSKNIQDHSLKTIKKVKILNEASLKEIVYGHLKEDSTFLNGILYRKEQFLEAIKEYSKNNSTYTN